MDRKALSECLFPQKKNVRLGRRKENSPKRGKEGDPEYGTRRSRGIPYVKETRSEGWSRGPMLTEVTR